MTERLNARFSRQVRPPQPFERAELDALSVPDDIVLRLTDDVLPGDRGQSSVLPHLAVAGPDKGAAIAVWQTLSSGDKRGGCVPGWLHKQGISYFRGWIRWDEPDFVMDWVIPIDDGTYEVERDVTEWIVPLADAVYVVERAGAGPYEPPPGADLQTFVNAVARFSYWMLVKMLDKVPRRSGG